MNIRYVATFAALTLLVGGCNDTADSGEDTGVDISVAADVTDASSDGSGAAPDATRDALDVSIVSCDGEDEFSPNHAAAEALPVESGSFEEDGLFICANTDDWYSVEADAGQVLFAEISFANRIGDLDLYVLPATGDLSLDSAVAVAGTLDDVEALRYEVESAGIYYVRVNSFEAAEGAYDVSIRLSCRNNDDCASGERCSYADGHCVEDFDPICGADDGEPNDHVGESTPITVDGGFAVFRDRVVCEEDDDYYVLKLDTPSTITAFLDFDTGANLDLRVYDPEGRPVGAAATENNNPEQLERRFSAVGDYITVVDQVVTSIGEDVTYTLSFEISPGACRSDSECNGVSGRSLCQDGACIGFDPDEPSPPGGPCDDASDCEGELQCYQGAGGFSDNFCTTTCEGDGQCGFFDGGYCLPVQQVAICIGPCAADSDCPRFYSCGDGARCELEFCGTDADCADGQRCRRTEQQNAGLCTSDDFESCAEDDDLEDNDTDGQATDLGADASTVDDALICDADDDWYRVIVEEGPSMLTASVEFDSVADIDVYIFDGSGQEIASGTEPDANPEVAEADLLGPGEYLIRVNQFPGDSDIQTGYGLDIEIDAERSRCTVEGGECLELSPLRIDCDEETGACGFLDGDGAVPLGGFCDSTSDCVDEAEFCWTRDSATEGRNVCTRPCREESDCRGVEGTTCVQFRRFGVCLPE